MNGSLYLQVRHDVCVNCNECAIAVACPAQAFVRVPASSPNLLGKDAREAVAALEQRRRRRGRGISDSQQTTGSRSDLPQPLAVRLRIRRAQARS